MTDKTFKIGGKTMKNDDKFTLNIPRDWRTAATGYPVSKLGSAEICRTQYKRGHYMMEGVDGYLFWYNHYRIPVTDLRIDGRVVMVDDPLHWIGMQRLAEASKGKVLVVGLGLGLVVHHLLDNPEVTRIDVVEINQEVMNLVAPYLRQDSRLVVRQGNGFEWRGEYDTVIIDILVKDQTEIDVFQAGSNLVLDPWTVWLRFRTQFSKASGVYLWGVRNATVNPAVKDTKEVKLMGELFG